MDSTFDWNEVLMEVLTALTSPLNLILLVICLYLLYKICTPQTIEDTISKPVEASLPKLKRKDFTIEELHNYDGKQNEGRILIAVNGKVFDVTKGKRFYGPGAAYGVFAGRDASRGLAKFKLDKETIKDEYDDLSDLKESELEEMREWELQFSEKYDFVGKLLRPGEEPTDYSDVSDTEQNKKEL